MRSYLAGIADRFSEGPIGRLVRQPTVRYLIVGSLLFLVDLAIVYSLVQSGMLAGFAQLFGRGTGAALGFVGHRLFTFRQKHSAWRFDLGTQSATYLLVAFSTFVASPVVLLLCLRLTSGHLIIAKVIAEAVLVCATYLALRTVFLHQETD